MRKPRIAVIAAGLLLALSIFCSASFAQDQGQALIEAAKQGDLKQVQELLEKGADINTKDKDGMTALMVACLNGHAEVVKDLLAKGADVNAEAKKGFTALKMASLYNYTEVVELLKAHGAKE
jgi:uncharacterized protein